jgi:hypothetical protein
MFSPMLGSDGSHDRFINRIINWTQDGSMQRGILLVAVLVLVKEFV